MRSIKKIILDKKDTQEIKGLVQVYEEMSATKIQKVREEIIIGRDFFDRLSRLSNEVGADLETAGLGATGEAYVFISSQTGLYGDIIDKVFASFVTFANNNKTADIYVLGKLGDSLMKSLAPQIKYKYIDLVDEDLEGTNLSLIIKDLVKYKKIYLFYGKFKNIVTQESWTSSISGQVLGQIQNLDNFDNKFTYLYEPEVNTIAKVFSEEIAALLFTQTLDESRLAKLASRLMYLDDSLEKIDKKLDILVREKNKSIKRRNERKQLTNFAGIMNYV